MKGIVKLGSMKSAFDHDGYVICRSVLDAELVREAGEHVDWLMARHPDLRPENLHHQLVWKDAFWVRLLSDDRILDCVEQIIGPNMALFASHYIAKPPEEGRAVLWHQDGSYWPIEPMEVVTAWLAINPATVDNGCMHIIPGSHRMDLRGVQPRDDVPSVLKSEMPLEFVDESQAVDILLEPGDISLHHPNIIHGSNANESDLWRKGLTMRYVPTTTRINGDPDEVESILMRGEAVAGINRYSPKPRYVAGEHMPFRDACEWNETLDAAAENTW